MKTIFRPAMIVRKVPLNVSEMDAQTRSRRGLFTEWIVTNGLGGYASGTIGGIATRRFHGWLIAALPAPHGRTMFVNRLNERLIVGETTYVLTSDDAATGSDADPVNQYLTEFELQDGLPVWTFVCDGVKLEKRLCMVHGQNTTYLYYKLLEGEKARLEIQPALHVRPHEGALEGPPHEQYRFTSCAQGFELCVANDLPVLRFGWQGAGCGFKMEAASTGALRYRIEQSRGYDWEGTLWSPGSFTAELGSGAPVALSCSTEEWERVQALSAVQSMQYERERRRRLLRTAPEDARAGLGSELILAADQFLITPKGRTQDQVRAAAMGDEVRTVIAGYHWFTDWGRDTMISLEGLTLSTGRYREAEFILRAFGNYVQRGLIPNMFPEGKTEGLYHTADATMWFFHALDRYYSYTNDWETVEYLLPTMVGILDWHLKGTDFGIGVDAADGLLKQGAEGYQLTWMDAKVGDWVVTPRRGKAVEINALWYNALRLTAEWLETAGNPVAAMAYSGHAERAFDSFEQRFWNAERGCLFDVVDVPKGGNDPVVRPNQVIAISPKYPVLREEHWEDVLRVVRDELVTPVGLRSLSPKEKDYKGRYDGNLLARDAAYHQGTVWAWLIGPFVDAWRKVYPKDVAGAREFLRGFDEHMSEDGVGTISEVFDAEAPYTPRGCMAQAWSVAEVLRCEALVRAAERSVKGE